MYPIEHHELDNGLGVVVITDRTVPSVATSLVYRVGSADEPPGKTGLAHLVEHLMFESSHDDADEPWLVQAHGGVCNGATTADFTLYHSQVPAGALELAVWLEARRLTTLPDRLVPATLDKHRAIIDQERRQRFGGVFGPLTERLQASLFPEEHPYRHPTIGTVEDLDAAGPQDIEAFFARHYQPRNAVLAVVGDVTADHAFAAAERYLAPIPSGNWCPPAGVEQLAPMSGPTRADVPVAALPYPLVTLGFRLPPNSVAPSADIFAAHAALRILAGGPASRVFRRLVTGEGIAHTIAADVDPRQATSIGIVQAHLIPGTPAMSTDKAVLVAEEVLLEELVRLVEEGPHDDELARWRSGYEREALDGLAPLQGRADALASFAAAFDDPAAISTYIDRIRSVEVEQVQRVTDTWLRPASRATVSFTPAATADF